MRYKRVLLVSPRFYKGRNRLSHSPLVGLGYISEALKRSGVNVSVFDMNLGYNFHDLNQKILEFKPELIGFTAMTLGYRYFYKLLEAVKKLHPHIKIVVGGAHISAVKEQALSACAAIDYGIILEGDVSVVQLCAGETFDKISGFIYRDNGRVITNQFGHFIDDLDNLPFPKYEAFELHKYPVRHLAMITSRGCPYDCIYCSVATSIGKKFRVRSAQSIADEIQYWYNQGYRDIIILDDNFTLIRKRVEDFCELLGKKDLKGLRLKNAAGVRGDKVDPTLLKAMRDAGFDYIAFGVESASDKVLRNIKKGEDISVIERGIKDACNLGFDVDLFFIIGSPGETMEDLKKSFLLALRYPVRRAIFYNLLPFPSTELLKWLTEKGYLTRPLEYILNDASYYKNQPCFYTPEMSIRDRKKAFKMGQKVYVAVRRRFIERKINAPTFMKKIFSSIYALPATENIVVNIGPVLRFKEVIKKFFIKI